MNIADFLVELTEAIAKQGHPTSGGALGGTFGYGALLTTPVFSMHPYCWCEREDCPWCAGCTCDDDAVAERGDCDFCTARGVFAEHHAEPGEGAPNFVHPRTGLKVWWYKYIGRSMNVVWGRATRRDLPAIFDECVASIDARAGAMTWPELLGEIERRSFPRELGSAEEIAIRRTGFPLETDRARLTAALDELSGTVAAGAAPCAFCNRPAGEDGRCSSCRKMFEDADL